MSILETLEQSGSLHILIYLLKKKEAKTSELLKNIPVGQTAFYTAVRKLLDEKLIEDEKAGYPVTRTFRLTNRGVFVAQKIREILDQIEKIK